ncbi:MAG: hypothetical protein HGA80_04070, partial [Candidatus Omnitrophica bacterium]|nr:hypothetical protein [Candidatus Omnitrophota bacterium]
MKLLSLYPGCWWRGALAAITALNFAFTPLLAQAQSIRELPQPGAMVMPAGIFQPPLVKGLVIDPQNPLRLSFMLDRGLGNAAVLKEDLERQARYFLAGLTVPERELWVNLSPYESDRIVTQTLGMTELGRDLLAQDYILKQLTASLLHPDNAHGRLFWSRLRAGGGADADLSVDDFNKIWIVPEKARVAEHGQGGVIVEARLKVMLEEDYLASRSSVLLAPAGAPVKQVRSERTKKLLREIIVPVIQREVSRGRNFARLRQIFYSLILAKWYRQKLGRSPLRERYVDRAMVSGVDIADRGEPRKIYDRYVAAYKKGVFDFIREETDTMSGEVLPRKYFSGGMDEFGMLTPGVFQSVQVSRLTFSGDIAHVDLTTERDPARIKVEQPSIYIWHSKGSRSFDDVDEQELKKLQALGINVLWMMGAWKTSYFSRRYNSSKGRLLNRPQLQVSAYSLDDYVLDENLGGETAFRRLVARAAKYGIKVSLDLVTNTMGIGRLLFEHPELFIQVPEGAVPAEQIGTLTDYVRGAKERPTRESEFVKPFFRFLCRDGKTRIFAHGKNHDLSNNDPNSIWVDTVAFDFSRPETQDFIRKKFRYIMELTQGGALRMDMFHIALEERFDHARFGWNGEYRTGQMPDNFWRDLFDGLRRDWPSVIFMAEAYGDWEGKIQAMGVLTYDTWHSLKYFNGPEGRHTADFYRLAEHHEYALNGIAQFENPDDPRERSPQEIFRHMSREAYIGLLGEDGFQALLDNGYIQSVQEDGKEYFYLKRDEDTILSFLAAAGVGKQYIAAYSDFLARAVARYEAALVGAWASRPGGMMINQGQETGKTYPFGKPNAVQQPRPDDDFFFFSKEGKFTSRFAPLMNAPLWRQGHSEVALVQNADQLPDGVLVFKRWLAPQDHNAVDYELGLVVDNYSDKEQTIWNIGEHNKWGLSEADRKDFEFVEIMTGDRIAFNDMMNRGSWTLKPWEAHVYRLQRKGVAAAVAANAGT